MLNSESAKNDTESEIERLPPGAPMSLEFKRLTVRYAQIQAC